MRMNILAKISIRNTEMIQDQYGVDVLHVNDPHALTQAVGYVKYTQNKNNESVFFRGQRKLYDGLRPSIFRDISINNTLERRKRLDLLHIAQKKLHTKK